MRNAQHGLSARQQFRQAGRRVLNAPADLALHEQRVNAALGLEGAEPLQGGGHGHPPIIGTGRSA